MRIMSNAFLIVHIAKNSSMTSTVSNETVYKIELSPCCQNKSLTKPVHVASQKPMKKRRCIKNRFSNLMILEVVCGRYCPFFRSCYFSLP